MPNYAKFMKRILQNKKRLEEFETMTMNEECSAVMQRKLPPKLKDSGRFIIPYSIGESFHAKAFVILALILI